MSPIASLSLQLEINDELLIINEGKIKEKYIDGPSTLASWTEVLCDAISLDITRSLNTAQSILGSPDAAELVTVITNPRYDPATNKFVKPNTAVKVLSNNEVIFTGTIFSADTEYVVDKETGKLSTNITITAHDATEIFNNTTWWRSNTETYNTRMSALAGKAGVGYVPPIGPVVTNRNGGFNLYTGGATNYPGLSTTWSAIKYTWNSQSGTQSVAGLAGKFFYAQFEYWTADWNPGGIKTVRNAITSWRVNLRIRDTYSAVHVASGTVRLIEEFYTDNPWTNGGTLIERNEGPVTNIPRSTAFLSRPVTIPASEMPANAKWWRMRIEWVVGDDIGNGSPYWFDEVYIELVDGSYSTTDYNSSITGATLSPHDNDATLWELAEMAVNSEVGLAFINREGKLEARIYDQLSDAHVPILNFSNVHDDTDPKHTCFTDMEVVYDTQNVVNELEVTNVVNKGSGDFEEVVDTYTDAQSLYDYGPRRSTLRTNLPTEAAIATAGSRVLALFATAEKRVRKIVFRPETAAQTLVDLGDYVTFHLALEGDEFTGEYLIVGVEHDVYPDNWVTTLELERAR